MSATTLSVGRAGPGHVVRIGHGLLRAQVVASDARRCRVGLLATTALLLGGDAVELDVRVGPAARLDLFDVAGTVAYHGRGRAASWRVRVEVGAGACFTYAGEPFVVADGADVERSLELDVAAGATGVVRDVVVLGRAGERGGPLRSRSTLRCGGRAVLVEDQRLDPDGLRAAPGMLGPHRVVDTVTWLGPTLATSGGPTVPPGVTTYALPSDAGLVARWLGSSAADSPLARSDLAARVGGV